jgi:hypothetical protein
MMNMAFYTTGSNLMKRIGTQLVNVVSSRSLPSVPFERGEVMRLNRSTVLK